MIDVGDHNIFGFRIGPTSDERQIRDVSIFMSGEDLTQRDNTTYLPCFIGQMTGTSDSLKRKIDYLKYENLFRGSNVTQIHNSLLHGNAGAIADEREYWAVYDAHRFMDWGETTDGFASFLIPFCGRLCLTHQSRDSSSPDYEVLDVVAGVETTPYYLIATIDETVSILQDETRQNHARR